MKKVVKTSLILLGAVFLFSALVAGYLYYLLYSPVPGTGSLEKVTFTVARGEKLESISQRLYQQGLLSDPAALKLASFLGGGSTDIKAGVHHIEPGLNAWQVFAALKKSPLKEHVIITIPEGKDIFEIAEILRESGKFDADKFLSLSRDPEKIKHLFPEARSLEGFLFPDTYHVPVDASEEDLLDMMLKQSFSFFGEELTARFAEHHLTLAQGITLSSLVAKEAGNTEEMVNIASVFHNRLQRGMKLDCDSTFIYAAKLSGLWDQKIHQSDIKRESPYNTYKIRGLPPGPIGNPGKDAVLAAANPSKTGYYYFVAKSTNQSEGHYFSETYSEHLNAVQKFRKAKRQALQAE